MDHHVELLRIEHCWCMHSDSDSALFRRLEGREFALAQVHEGNHPRTTDLNSVRSHSNTLDLHLGHSPGSRLRRSHNLAFSGVLKAVVLKKAAEEDNLALELSLELPFWAFAPASCSQEHADGDDCGDSHHRLIFSCTRARRNLEYI